MKTLKLIVMSFIFGIGLLVPAGIASADPCHEDKGKDSITVAGGGHHDDDDDDDECGTTTTAAPETTIPETTTPDTTIPDTTVVTPTTIPYDLPETGTNAVVMSITALAAIAAGLIAIYIRRVR